MVYKIPPDGGGGVNHTQPVAYRFYLSYDKYFEISFLA